MEKPRAVEKVEAEYHISITSVSTTAAVADPELAALRAFSVAAWLDWSPAGACLEQGRRVQHAVKAEPEGWQVEAGVGGQHQLSTGSSDL